MTKSREKLIGRRMRDSDHGDVDGSSGLSGEERGRGGGCRMDEQVKTKALSRTGEMRWWKGGKEEDQTTRDEQQATASAGT